jgi:hypothetical protein
MHVLWAVSSSYVVQPTMPAAAVLTLVLHAQHNSATSLYAVTFAVMCTQRYLDPFTIRYAVPLGTATGSAAYASPQLLNVPYIATVGQPGTSSSIVSNIAHGGMGTAGTAGTTAPAETPQQVSQQQQQQEVHLTDPARFGLGGYSAGIWNFAYGANMSPRKLVGSRGRHPLQSVPAVLKGYKLAFNHRWALLGARNFWDVMRCYAMLCYQ